MTTVFNAVRRQLLGGCLGAGLLGTPASADARPPRAADPVEIPTPPEADPPPREAAASSSTPVAAAARAPAATPTRIAPPRRIPASWQRAPAATEEDDGMTRKVVVGSMFEADELPRVAGSAHVISRRELERYENDDVHRVLANVPGVYVRGEDGFGLRPNIGLRGANPDRSSKITLLEDGILLGPAPYSAPAAYYFPLPTRMVGVEVFKGPASIRHGPNTIGGAINFRTRDIPSANEMVLDVAGGRFGYAKGHGYWGMTHKGFGVLLEAAHLQSQGFKRLDGGGNTGFRKNEAMVKLGYEAESGPDTGHRVQLKGGFANEVSNETYLGLTRADFDDTPYRRYAATQRDRMTWWRSQVELDYIVGNPTLQLETRIYRHDFHRVWRRLDRFRDGPDLSTVLSNPDAGQLAVLAAVLRGDEDALPDQALMVTKNDRRFVSQGAQSLFRWRPEWRPDWGKVTQDLEVGLRVHNDSIARNHIEDAYLMTTGQMLPEGTEPVVAARNRGETTAAAFHVHDAVTFLERVTLAGGLRVEMISMRYRDRLTDVEAHRLDTAVSPGIGALVQALPWLGVFAGLHRGFSPVAPGQPEAVKPERSLNYETGVRAVKGGLWAEAVGFFSDYSNLNGVCTFSAGCADGDGSQQFNGGRVWVYGLESLVRYRHRFRSGFGLEVGAQYTYTGSQFRRSFTSAFTQWGEVEVGDHLPYVPEHLVGGTFGVGGRIWDVSVRPMYTGPMRDVAGQGTTPAEEKIDGFFLLDLSAEVRVLRRLQIYGQMGNVTGNAYVASFRPYGIRPGAPLTFMFGIKVHVFP
jgi:Fe(3+) dicitrate transport protein